LFIAGNSYAGGNGCRFSVVRYGNVIGSKGSVVPTFLQLARSGKFPITDRRMTRFWITLEHGVEFVLQNFERMHGGGIFIPKIPSMKVVDLSRALAPEKPLKHIGIRPGEKLHEVMCPRDDSHLTLEFKNHYLIQPTINMVGDTDFSVSRTGEKGKPVPDGFEYNSGTNTDWLTAEKMKDMFLHE